jgi:hypothetical protein
MTSSQLSNLSFFFDFSSLLLILFVFVLSEVLEDIRKNRYYLIVRSLLKSPYRTLNDYVDRKMYL